MQTQIGNVNNQTNKKLIVIKTKSKTKCIVFLIDKEKEQEKENQHRIWITTYAKSGSLIKVKVFDSNGIFYEKSNCSLIKVKVVDNQVHNFWEFKSINSKKLLKIPKIELL